MLPKSMNSKPGTPSNWIMIKAKWYRFWLLLAVAILGSSTILAQSAHKVSFWEGNHLDYDNQKQIQEPARLACGQVIQMRRLLNVNGYKATSRWSVLVADGVPAGLDLNTARLTTNATPFAVKLQGQRSKMGQAYECGKIVLRMSAMIHDYLSVLALTDDTGRLTGIAFINTGKLLE
ncbi:MAG: hypothetical protein JNM27_23185 [Leptospirales bacterium]|nr:hypothetical protein [Leptospirales bacterium]